MDNNQPQPLSEFLRFLKWSGITVLGGFMLLVTLFLISAVWGSVDSNPMVAVADRLHPQQGWTKEGENITSRNTTISDTKPGTMWRTWLVPDQKVQDIDIEAYAKDAGYTIVRKAACEDNTPRYTSSDLPACTLYASRDGFAVKLETYPGPDDSHTRLSVSVGFKAEDIYYGYPENNNPSTASPSQGSSGDAATQGTGVQFCTPPSPFTDPFPGESIHC